MNRKSGVLMHISSLWGEFSSGKFGKEALDFIDFLSDCDFSYWQVLPFGETDRYGSPYNSPSAFTLNPLFIDPYLLYEDALVSINEINTLKEHPVKEKQLIYKAYKRYPKNIAFDAFVNLYFLRSWNKIKKYANKKGVKIIGDMPFYVKTDTDIKNFILNKDGEPGYVSGAPPDDFCPNGQLWGNPIYDWDKMKKEDYRWWLDRIGFLSGIFDGIRLDHFLGFNAFWAVPAGEGDAKNGEWMYGPGKDFIKAIKETFPRVFFIAEDLGTLSVGAKELLSYSGFPGMRVVQFGIGDNTLNPHLPHNYEKNVVAYTGTHDNNTLLGFLKKLNHCDLRMFLKCFQYTKQDLEGAVDAIIHSLYESNANTVILPIQDILKLDENYRMNTPGTKLGNWRFRITKKQFESIDREKFKNLNFSFQRV